MSKNKSEFTGIIIHEDGTFTVDGTNGSVKLTKKDIRRINDVAESH